GTMTTPARGCRTPGGRAAMFHPNGPTFFELAQQALSSTERGYDLLAPKFDYTPFRTPQFLLDAVACQLPALGPFGWGLDLCCGTGAALAMVRPFCTEAVVGLDTSQGMLDVCRRRVAEAPGEARVELVRGNALALPFGPAFDVIVSFGAFGHILVRDEPRFVGEIARVLRPGGRFIFVTTYPPRAGSLGWLLARGFNAAMHVRNWLLSPPFIMYYLTFLLPAVRVLLERNGLQVEVRGLDLPRPFTALRLVVATRPQ
ncbi:MAG TPA: class I SAM-dependent methyltransferase, partial [Gemmataceae bacterium]|nr:class I SAM-dependent methyltransferase [Gemmataceae bacterium]